MQIKGICCIWILNLRKYMGIFRCIKMFCSGFASLIIDLRTSSTWVGCESLVCLGRPMDIRVPLRDLVWSFEWLYPFGIPYWIFECLSEFFASEVFILWGGPLDSKTGQATLIDRNKVYFLVPKLAVWPLKYVFNCNFLTISADFTWFFYTFLTTSADFTFVTNIRLTLIKN